MPPRTESLPAARSGRACGRVIAAGVRALLLLLLLGSAVSAQVPPDARWRTLETPHFRVNYMAGLDSLANRTAVRAEWAYALLTEELAEPPSGRIDIVLTDAVDYANGSATPFPTNRIVLYAHPPTDVRELAFTTDWLELLVLHELVHIFHLDEAGGVWEALRSVLGRNALLFPHAFSPSWLVEGLATLYESRLTPGGRVRGTLFDMALRTAILQDEFFSIDQASGTPRSWPAGSTRYIYGALFLDFLSRTRGDEAFRDFLEQYGSQLVPYRLNRAARESFGAGFTPSWHAWTDSLRLTYRTVADSLSEAGLTEPEILTTAGRDAHYPRFDPSGGRIAYTAATGREQPAVRIIEADGGERVVAPRTTPGPLSWTPGGEAVLFGDVEFRGPHRIFADLWRAPVGEAGERRRITRSARLDQPDVHPDGRTVVAVQNDGGSNSLVVGALSGSEFRTVVAPSAEVHWAQPRWSPSGDTIAAVRWSPGGLHDVVLLDRDGRLLTEITRDRAVDGSPAWSPDGRYLLFWSDRTGIPNLFAYEVGEDRVRQVTRVVTGAFDPDVSPDGRWIAFSYYQADGYHIARMPFAPEEWWAAPPPRPGTQPLESLRTYPPVVSEDRPYSPWPTVRPAAWTFIPTAGTDLGAGLGVALGGVDVVGRHRWAAEALWYLRGGRFDGGAAYRYQGWGNPALEISAAQNWSVACQSGSLSCGSEQPLESALLRREREAAVSVLWVRQRIRSYAWLRPGASIESRDLTWEDANGAEGLTVRQVPADVALRLEAGRSSARAFDLTVGPQTGSSFTASIEGHRYTEALQGDRNPTGYVRTVGRGRVFQGVRVGRSAHVLALRGDVGLEFGSRSPGFEAGGAGGGVLPLAVELEVVGGGVSFPIRGYPEGAQFGNRIAVGSAEYRFPLLRVERGLGLIPVYLDRFTADLFVDAGSAWCPGACPARLSSAPGAPRVLTSIGGEVLAETRFGFHTAVPLRFGLALPLRDESTVAFYLRVGRSF